jgi:hypothetical protein
VNEGTLGVHKIELVVKTSRDLTDGGGVGDHQKGTLNLGQVTSWNNSWWLVVDGYLECGWAPVNELDGTLGLNGGDGAVNVFGYNITTVHKNARHVLSVARVALNHHGGRLEYGTGDFTYTQLFVVRFLGGNDWRVRAKWETNSWVWYQVSLESSHVNVDLTIEAKGRRDGGNDLRNQTVQVGVRWALNVKGATADVVQGFVINHESNIGVLKHTVRRKNGVVWLYNSGGALWGWVYTEKNLGFATVVHRQAF